LRLYRRATPDGNPRQLTSEAPGTPYGLAQASVSFLRSFTPSAAAERAQLLQISQE
jgi:hypothetical protein